MKKILILSALSIFLSADDVTQLSSSGGRFVFGQVGKARADQFLLDTQTGRMWQAAVNSSNQTVLEPISFIMPSQYESYLPRLSEPEKLIAFEKFVRAQGKGFDRQKFDEQMKSKYQEYIDKGPTDYEAMKAYTALYYNPEYWQTLADEMKAQK